MTLDAGAAADPRGQGPVLRITRWGLWALLSLAVLNGAFLYLLPGQAATRYAWSIRLVLATPFSGGTGPSPSWA